jgi:hypothetical protein
VTHTAIACFRYRKLGMSYTLTSISRCNASARLARSQELFFRGFFVSLNACFKKLESLLRAESPGYFEFLTALFIIGDEEFPQNRYEMP